jgi:AraC-like DNA-binding protein
MEATHAALGVPSHAHHAIQVAVLLRGTMTVGTPGAKHADPIVAIDADAQHYLELDGAAALLFIDPESAAGRAAKLDLLAGRDVVAVAPERLECELADLQSAWRDQRSAADLKLLGQNIVQDLLGKKAAPPTDPRVADLIADLAERLDGPVGLSNLARSIELSPSRLRHLFVEQTGMPLKSYILWRRLMRAVELVAQGSTMTDAAHAAGFSDSAHFSRTCRRMFGLPASALEFV